MNTDLGRSTCTGKAGSGTHSGAASGGPTVANRWNSSGTDVASSARQSTIAVRSMPIGSVGLDVRHRDDQAPGRRRSVGQRGHDRRPGLVVGSSAA